MGAPGPVWLYLHGFASGPASAKAVSLSSHYASSGIELRRLDLRKPSLEYLRLSTMIEAVRGAIGTERDRAVVFGSSLGGLTAARVAERDARVCALVLLAPAFRFPERWRARLGDDGFDAWRRTGWLPIEDYAEARPTHVDFGFYEDASAIDAENGGWPDVRIPTLILHGVRDDIVDIELSRTFARERRHVRLVELDDDHALGASVPRIAAEADAFLGPFLGR